MLEGDKKINIHRRDAETQSKTFIVIVPQARYKQFKTLHLRVSAVIIFIGNL